MGSLSLRTLKRRVTWIVALAALIWIYLYSAQQLEFSFVELIQKGPRFFNLLSRMWPPRFEILSQIWGPLFETIQMAVLGTAMGALLALPMVMLTSRTVTRTSGIYYPARFIMSLFRSIPAELYAILFVAALGIGPLPGIPALTIFSAAIITKLTSESAENIDTGPIEALEATGAQRPAVVTFSVLPQIMPLFLSYSLYMFELNIRIASILAVVGAGGIGQNLVTALDWFDYPAALTILIVIFVCVFGIDMISSRFRESFVEGSDLGPVFKWSLSLIAVAAIVWALSGVDFDMERLGNGIRYLGGMFTQMFRPAWAHIDTAVAKMGESIQIALLGTTIAMVLAFPFGFLCARNLMPRTLAYGVRQGPNVIRTFSEIILAIFLIAAFGPGPFAGVLTIGIHSIGMLSRLYYEVVETIDRGPLEALSSLGATGAVRFRYAVLPQVLPEFLAMAIYRFEINVRAATVLGIVGAGGIGSIILRAVRQGRWSEVGLYLLVVIVTVMIIDYLSAIMRRKIIEG